MLHGKIGDLEWVTREEEVEFFSTVETCIKYFGPKFQEEGFQSETSTRADHLKRLHPL